MGYKSAISAARDLRKEFNKALQEWDTVELPEGFIGTENMSLDVAKAFTNSIKQMNLGADKNISNDFAKGIKDMVSDLDVDE
jgi:hypothetical protein